jgi:hypothetical protein
MSKNSKAIKRIFLMFIVLSGDTDVECTRKRMKKSGLHTKRDGSIGSGIVAELMESEKRMSTK